MGGPREGLEGAGRQPRRAARTYALKALASVLEPLHHTRLHHKLLRRRASIVGRLQVLPHSPSSKPRPRCVRHRRMCAAFSPAAGSTASRSDPSGASTRRIWKASCAGAAVPDVPARSRGDHLAKTTREVASHANGLQWELATRSSSANRHRARADQRRSVCERSVCATRPSTRHGVLTVA
jgi:hypothetical protein